MFYNADVKPAPVVVNPVVFVFPFFVRSDMRSGVITKRQASLSAARQIETTSICPVLQASSSLSLCVGVKPRVEVLLST